MNSLYPVICSDTLLPSRDFYVSLFELVPVFDIDWYVQLQSPHDENLQLAFVDRQHPSVPVHFREVPQGVLVTIELKAVDPVYEKAKSLDLKIELELKDEEWGQRHFMTVDPNGLLVDVVQMIQPTQTFLERHGLA